MYCFLARESSQVLSQTFTLLMGPTGFCSGCSIPANSAFWVKLITVKEAQCWWFVTTIFPIMNNSFHLPVYNSESWERITQGLITPGNKSDFSDPCAYKCTAYLFPRFLCHVLLHKYTVYAPNSQELMWPMVWKHNRIFEIKLYGCSSSGLFKSLKIFRNIYQNDAIPSHRTIRQC